MPRSAPNPSSSWAAASNSRGSRTKNSSISTAAAISTPPKAKGTMRPMPYRNPLPSVAINVPTPPIRLMTPLACERSGLGVRSGMRAITGVRKLAIAVRKTPMATMNSASGVPRRSTCPLSSGGII